MDSCNTSPLILILPSIEYLITPSLNLPLLLLLLT